MKIVFCLAASFFCLQSLFAQQDSAEKKVPVLELGVRYQSNSVYLGRKDSLPLPYVIPNIRFTSPSGFYASAETYLLTSESRADAFSLDAGWEFSKGNLYAGIGASAYMFNSQSVNVLAEASTSINSYLGFSLPFIQPGINGALIFGKGSLDYITGFSLEHNFTTANEAFSLTPGIYLNAGTQNYYNEYYQERKYNTGSGTGRGKKSSNSGNGSSSAPVIENVETLQSSQFRVLDYEFAAPVEYKHKQLAFSFVPRYAIAQSPSTVVMTTKAASGAVSTQTFTEKISNSFYWTLGVSYHFNLKKHA